MLQERQAALHSKVKDLYEQAKSIWKGVLFEILLDPINPEPGEVAERHIIDYRDCVEDFELNKEPDRELSLDELLTEIKKLKDYKNILKAANESIENIKEEYKDKYTVTLVRVLDYTNHQENYANLDIFESESEIETEVEEEEEAEDAEEEWDAVWESDSGVESPVEYEQQPNLYSSEEESDVDNGSDSGLNSESADEPDWLLNWESGSESDRPPTSEPNEDQENESSQSYEDLKLESSENEEYMLNWESDSESIIVRLEYESDEDLKLESNMENEKAIDFDSESNASSHIELEYEDEPSEQQFACESQSISKLDSEEKPTDISRLGLINKCEEEFIVLGPNYTSLPKSVYEAIPWKTARKALNALLKFIFGERLPPYNHLSQQIFADICFALCSKSNISEHEVQCIIETKCGDKQEKLKCSW